MEKLKGILDKFTKLRHSGLIIAAMIIGLVLVLFPTDGFGTQNSHSSPERSIRELCERICHSNIYVTVSTNSLGDICGVALVLDGGDTPQIRLKLTEAVSTLYSLSSSKIYITAPIN
jgi:hypothetical protein